VPLIKLVDIIDKPENEELAFPSLGLFGLVFGESNGLRQLTKPREIMDRTKAV
jgi:hypothetical protein